MKKLFWNYPFDGGVNFSCKKDDDEAVEQSKTIEVEYKIDSPNPYFVEISYSNEANNMVTLRDN